MDSPTTRPGSGGPHKSSDFCRRNLASARLFLARDDVCNHCFWKRILPTWPPLSLIVHLCSLFRVSLNQAIVPATSTSEAWGAEVDRFSRMFARPVVKERTLNWFDKVVASVPDDNTDVEITWVHVQHGVLVHEECVVSMKKFHHYRIFGSGYCFPHF